MTGSELDPDQSRLTKFGKRDFFLNNISCMTLPFNVNPKALYFIIFNLRFEILYQFIFPLHPFPHY